VLCFEHRVQLCAVLAALLGARWSAVGLGQQCKSGVGPHLEQAVEGSLLGGGSHGLREGQRSLVELHLH